MNTKNKTTIKFKLFLSIIILSTLFIGYPTKFVEATSAIESAIEVASPYIYNFNSPGTLKETSEMSLSSSPYWWLNSGAYLKMNTNGHGSTNQGSLEPLDPWRNLYSTNNPTDTDKGLHPQNIFRLVTRNKWSDFSQEMYFKINTINLSPSINRNLSNGVLLFLRYQDGNNLYYAGLRVDGTAVIKKKINGEYFTLAQKPVFEGTYDRNSMPSLIPLQKWMGIKSEIINNLDSSVSIRFFVDEDGKKEWKLILEVKDDVGGFDKKPIVNTGFAGIRSDFMDLEFKDFKIINL